MTDPLLKNANTAVQNTQPQGLGFDAVAKDQSGMNRDQIATRAQTLTAPTIPVPEKANKNFNIPVADITPATKLNLPQPEVQINEQALSGGFKQGQKSLDDYIKELTPATETSAQKESNAVMDSIKTLLPQTVGKESEVLKAQQDAGVNKQLTELTRINNEIKIKQAQYDQAFASAELQPGVPLQTVLGQQGAVRRSQLAEIGVLQARATGMQGNIELSRDLASQAIEAKYADIEANINAKVKQLELIQPQLDKEESNRAEALKRQYDDEQAKVKELKEKSKTNLELAFGIGVETKFANKNGEMFRVSDGKPYDNVEEFLADAGVTSFEEVYERGLITDVTAEQVSDMAFLQQLRADYQDAGINPYQDTAEEAIQKVQDNSYKYGKETYMEAPSSGGFDTVKIGDKTYYQNPVTGELLDAENFIIGGNTQGGSPAQQAQKQETERTLNLINEIQNSPGLSSAVGANFASRATGFLGKVNDVIGNGSLSSVNGQQANFVGSVEQLVKQLTTQSFADAKAKGVTFGAASEAEWNILGQSATKISQWKVVKDGNVVGYNIDENSFKQELNQLSKYAIENYNTKNNIQDTPTTQSSPVNINKGMSGLDFGSSGDKQVKGSSQSIQKLPLLNMDGSEKTPILPLMKAYPAGSYPAGKPGSLANQCGYFVRSIVNKQGLTYPSVGNSLAEKRATAKRYGVPITQAKPGSVLLTSENKTSGHVAYITGIAKNGFTLAESNFKAPEKVSYGRVIPFNSPNILGVINPTKS